MRFLLVGILLVAMPLFGEEVPKGREVYERFPSFYRPMLVRSYSREIDRLERTIADTQAIVAKLDGDERKRALESIKACENSLAEMKEKNDPPFVGMRLGEYEVGVAEYKNRYLWFEGDIGISEDSFVVIEIVDGSTSILHRQNARAMAHGMTENQIIYLANWPTEKWAVGKTVTVEKPLWVSGETKTVRLSSGRFITGIPIEPFDWNQYQKAIKKQVLGK